jgi:hypothetical protein
VETLLTLSSALLGGELVKSQMKDGDLVTVPAGTVLAYVDLYPDFARQDGGTDETRLYKAASIFMRYKFSPTSCVNFVPSAGALANGQIGMFITSDPRYEVTVTGQDAVRLVHEFNGTVSQISQPMCLRLPSQQDWLYVNDAHESDIRFTRQGTLWIIAFTDIDSSAVGPSLGEFRLDYDIEMKDNAVDGVELQDVTHTEAQYFACAGDTYGITTTASTTVTALPFTAATTPATSNVIYGPNSATQYFSNVDWPNAIVTDATTGANMFAVTLPMGLYNISVKFSFSADFGNASANFARAGFWMAYNGASSNAINDTVRYKTQYVNTGVVNWYTFSDSITWDNNVGTLPVSPVANIVFTNNMTATSHNVQFLNATMLIEKIADPGVSDLTAYFHGFRKLQKQKLIEEARKDPDEEEWLAFQKFRKSADKHHTK